MSKYKNELKNYLEEKKILVDRALRRYLNSGSRLGPAMRYSVFNGGKRLRPVLMLAAAEICAGEGNSPVAGKIMPFACAVELIHSYSLVHDDLPAMDDDDWRRGKPSCHKRFGEALAILTGDALLTKAFEIINSPQSPALGGVNSVQGPKFKEAVAELARASGVEGLVGGQAEEIVSLSRLAKKKTRPAVAQKLLEIYKQKTGALIKASLKVGAILSGASLKELKALGNYADNFGPAFQISDDFLDTDEFNFVKLNGLKESRIILVDFVEQAKNSLSRFGSRAWVLKDLADYLLTRKK